MDQTALVGLEIANGAQVISVLDRAGIKPNVALWMSTPEFEEGRLVLSSPALDQAKPLHAYEQVFEALHGEFRSMPPPLLILPARSAFVKALRSRFGKTAATEGMRLGGQTFGDQFISDAYVYRIQ
jgi:hypothetical protein